MSPTAKTLLLYTLTIAVCATFLFFPETAFAQSGGAIRAKLDEGRTSYAVPIGLGIIGTGATISVILWALDVMDWKGMAKWCLAAMIVGVIGGAVAEFAG